MAETKHSDLVYDVGMNRGEDTEFYLKMGYRVVGFEADPQLVDYCRKRFPAALSDGQLNIVAGVICADQPASGSVAFYRSTNDQWGTVCQDWDERNQQLGSTSSVIHLQAIDFAECLAQFGIPHYMKVDIEGADLICAKALLQFTGRPDYLSIESTKTDFSALLGEFGVLSQLGYSRFAVVQQQTIDGKSYKGQSLGGASVRHVFPRGASGPFGTEIEEPYLSQADAISEYERVFRMYRMFGDDSALRRNALGRHLYNASWRLQKHLRLAIPGWYDTHAALH
ncbi:FkbM family methyltransferase [Bradyrhizobium sp. UFLA05-109]